MATSNIYCTYKNGAVRFISDFIELNKRIQQKPFLIPKIQDLLLKLEGFNICQIIRSDNGILSYHRLPCIKQFCTIVLPCAKYK